MLRAQEEAQKEGPVYPTDGSEYPSEYHVVTGAWPADLIVSGRRHAAIVLARKFVGTTSCQVADVRDQRSRGTN